MTVRVEGIDGRVAVVTGAARGIGRAIVESLAANGARVAGFDLAAPDYPGVLGVACDVADERAVERGFAIVEGQLGPVSILVLNAAIFPSVALEETSLELWQHTLAINLTGAFLCARRALPAMRAQGYGRLVAVASVAGKTGGARHVPAYAASKAGLMTLMKSIASGYAAEGITSNAVAPALIDTEMSRELHDLVGRIPVGRMGTPGEVAAAVTFLCGEEAAFITGEVVDVNGGFLID